MRNMPKKGHVKQVCRAGRQRNTVPQKPQYAQPVLQQQQYARTIPQQQYAQPVIQRQQVNVDGKTRCYQCGQF